ncbi:MAG: TadE family protein [Gemmataceae bacterium]
MPSRNRRRRPAVALVEAAVVLNVLFLLMFAVFEEYGRFVMFRQLVDNAAREGRAGD